MTNKTTGPYETVSDIIASRERFRTALQWIANADQDDHTMGSLRDIAEEALCNG